MKFIKFTVIDANPQHVRVRVASLQSNASYVTNGILTFTPGEWEEVMRICAGAVDITEEVGHDA